MTHRTTVIADHHKHLLVCQVLGSRAVVMVGGG